MRIDSCNNSDSEPLPKNYNIDIATSSERIPRNKVNISNSNIEHPLRRKSKHFSSDLFPSLKKDSLDFTSLLSKPALNYNSINNLPFNNDQFLPKSSKVSILPSEEIYLFNNNYFVNIPSQSNSNSISDSTPCANIPNSFIDDSEVFKNDEFDVFNPHWDDMITFRESRLKLKKRRTWSISHSLNAVEPIRNSISDSFSNKIHNSFYRFIIIMLLPILITLAWVSVPIPTRLKPSESPTSVYQSNFWVFLFFYYGIYNICALMLVTHIFHLYSLNWWPESMSAVSANVTSWIFSMSIGAILYRYDVKLLHNPLTWTAITLITLLFPLIISFAQIRRQYSTITSRQTVNQNPEDGIFFHSLEWRTPSSYNRFLWFTGIFITWYIALTAGEYLAHLYVSTLPHNNVEGLYYVYTWLITVNLLDVVSGWKLVCTFAQPKPVFYSTTSLIIMDCPVYSS
ncbi:hypothetical protein AYI70_g304 [Smittium culicis]|uniref:Uncharacterized protein n=1 Tax=Smittium culicis TaxID=133412 RepID=A0A1R1YHB1_9FUNG|nr:hypothetical protein AYI70_g304 [Smittium culicis]